MSRVKHNVAAMLIATTQQGRFDSIRRMHERLMTLAKAEAGSAYFWHGSSWLCNCCSHTMVGRLRAFDCVPNQGFPFLAAGNDMQLLLDACQRDGAALEAAASAAGKAWRRRSPATS